jgi:uncharacterized protein YacL
MWLFFFRVLVVLLLAHAGYVYSPFGQPLFGLLIGLGAAAALLTLETKLRTMPGRQMLGAVLGGAAGLLGARLVWGALRGLEIGGWDHFVHTFLVVFLVYMGIVIGGSKAEWFEPSRLVAAFRDGSPVQQYKILDTSVIIDGRIADICETGFLEGTLVVPQFVLRELQQVADSSDSLKRNRGRRGLDILQKVQKMAGVTVQIVETDFPEVREVDMKLIELARKMNGKIVTNDFNLNKVAQLRGVLVLNINELANSLKPVVLPGEVMRVFILKEGKEAGQGVGYLDDGTMVVVDQGKKALGRTIEVSVTSVLQTTAGKMIFCRWAEASPGEDTGRFRRERNGRREGERTDRWQERPTALGLPTPAEVRFPASSETPRPGELQPPDAVPQGDARSETRPVPKVE